MATTPMSTSSNTPTSDLSESESTAPTLSEESTPTEESTAPILSEEENAPASCFWCLAPAVYACPHCNLVSYCSEAHLTLHRDDATKYCFPFKVLDSGNDNMGRFMVATRDLAPLELLFTDEPLTIGPSRSIKGIVCVECFKEVDGKITCDDCGFPICKEDLERFSDQDGWHKRLECPYFTSKEIMASTSLLRQQLSAITPLRLLLKPHPLDAQLFCPSVQEIPLTPLEKAFTIILKKDFKWPEESDSSEILDAIRKLSFNAKTLEAAGFKAGTGLFARYSMINHKCVVNTRTAVVSKDGYKLNVRAQVPIKKGDEINVRYISANTGQPTRHAQTMETWNFHCACARCFDPTDLDTFNSAIRCKSCNDGFVLPQEGGLKFWCEACKVNMSVIQVQAVMNEGIRITNSKAQNRDPKDFEDCITELEKLFHPKNFMVQQVKFALVALLHKLYDESNTPTDQITRSVSLGQELICLVQRLDPGMGSNKAQVLETFIPASKRLADRLLAEGKIEQEKFNWRVKHCKQYAKEYIACRKK